MPETILALFLLGFSLLSISRFGRVVLRILGCSEEIVNTKRGIFLLNLLIACTALRLRGP